MRGAEAVVLLFVVLPLHLVVSVAAHAKIVDSHPVVLMPAPGGLLGPAQRVEEVEEEGCRLDRRACSTDSGATGAGVYACYRPYFACLRARRGALEVARAHTADAASLGPADTTAADDPGDRAALLALYAATSGSAPLVHARWSVGDDDPIVDDDDGGAGWRHSSGWASNASVCTWYGVKCSATTARVIALDLHDNRLIGSIPSAISHLSALQILILANNYLHGVIPDSMCSMASLAKLDLSENSLAGAIPKHIGNMSGLVVLELFSNELSGTLPSNLVGLVVLSELVLDDNRLAGSIPSVLGQLSSLLYLGLDHNELSGTIPASFSNTTGLYSLSLNSNKLTGTIPAALGGLPFLQVLGLGFNMLTGTIPSELGNLGLQGLALNSNALSGTIPSALGALSSLDELFLYGNKLSGTIPEAIANIAELNSLFMYDNLLTGGLPEFASGEHELTYLDVHNNLLTGSIPPSVLALPNLVLLLVHNNRFEGTLPSLAGAPLLLQADFSGNLLHGTLPDDVGWYGGVATLNVSGNSLVGTVPPSVLWHPNLTTLVACGNLLTGVSTVLPPRRPAHALAALDLAYNLMSGEIPGVFCTGVPTISLTLSFQQLTGTIPACLASPTLAVLDLSGNYFYGAVPGTFAASAALTRLVLSNNNLNESLPSALFLSLRNASHVDVSQNFMGGELPATDIANSGMRVLDVTRNCGLTWPMVWLCPPFAGCSPLQCTLAATCDLLPQLPATLCEFGRAPAPVAVAAGSFGAGGALTVAWSPPPLVHARYCAPSGYVVNVTLSGGALARPPLLVPATTRSAIVDGVESGVPLLVTVAAVNCVGVGAASYPTSAVAVAPPGPPRSLTAAGRNSAAALAWDAPGASGVILTGYTVHAARVGGDVIARPVLPANGSCHQAALLDGLDYDAPYVFRVRAECALPPPYCPGVWSDWSPPVVTLVPPSFIDQVMSAGVVAAAASGVAALYGGLLCANRRWPGRDFAALFSLLSMFYQLLTDVQFGVKLVRTQGAGLQQGAFFAALGATALWSASRVAWFMRTALQRGDAGDAGQRLRQPSPLTFHGWCVAHRAWASSIAALACVQLSVLCVLQCRAFGPLLDGVMAAPVDRRLWASVRFHATATGVVRSGATLLIILTTYGGQDYWLLGVVAKLAGAVGTLSLACATLLVDAAVAARRRGSTAPVAIWGGVAVPLLSETERSDTDSGKAAPAGLSQRHGSVASDRDHHGVARAAGGGGAPATATLGVEMQHNGPAASLPREAVVAPAALSLASASPTLREAAPGGGVCVLPDETALEALLSRVGELDGVLAGELRARLARAEFTR